MTLPKEIKAGSTEFQIYFNLISKIPKEQYQLVIDQFKTLLKKQPQNENIYFSIAYLQGKQQKYQDSIESYKHAILLQPNSLNIYYYTVYPFKNTKQYQQGIDFLRQHLNDANQYNYDLLTALGNLYYYSGQYQKSIIFFERALKSLPKDHNPDKLYSFLGNSYRAAGRLHQAIKNYQQSIHYDPENSYTLSALGYSYYDIGYYQLAVESHQKTLQINRANNKLHLLDNRYNYNSLGKCYIALNQPENAIKMYQNALNLKPNHYSYYGLGSVYIAQKRYQEALQLFQEALLLEDGQISNLIAILDQIYALKHLISQEDIEYTQLYTLLNEYQKKLTEQISQQQTGKNTAQRIFRNQIWSKVSTYTIVAVFNLFYQRVASFWKQYEKRAANIDHYQQENIQEYTLSRLELIKEIFYDLKGMLSKDESTHNYKQLINLSTIYFIMSDELNKQLLILQETLIRSEEQKKEEQEQMLQSFSHNLKNRIKSASSPLENLKSSYSKDNVPDEIEDALLEIKKIDRISNALTFSFKITPETLKVDLKGSQTLYTLILSALYNSLSTIISHRSFYPDLLERYFKNQDTLEAQAIEALGDLPSENSLSDLTTYFQTYLFPFDIDINLLKNCPIGDNALSATIFSILFDELMLNILKGTATIKADQREAALSAQIVDDQLILTCSNTTRPKDEKAKTTGMGLKIIKNIIGGLKGGYHATQHDNTYHTHITLNNFWR